MFITALTYSSLFNVLSLNRSDIWTLIKEGYSFLEAPLTANTNGTPIHVECNDNMILLINGNNVMEFRPEVIPYLKKSESNFEKLSKLISQERGIDEVSLSQNAIDDESVIYFGETEKYLFEQKTKLEFCLSSKIFHIFYTGSQSNLVKSRDNTDMFTSSWDVSGSKKNPGKNV